MIAGQAASQIVGSNLSTTAVNHATGLKVKADGDPIGTIKAWPSSQTPDTEEWLECDGSTFDTAKYPELYAALGSGKLPDYKGQFLRGGDRSNVGKRFEDTIKTHTVTVPDHKHTYSGTVGSGLSSTTVLKSASLSWAPGTGPSAGSATAAEATTYVVTDTVERKGGKPQKASTASCPRDPDGSEGVKNFTNKTYSVGTFSFDSLMKYINNNIGAGSIITDNGLLCQSSWDEDGNPSSEWHSFITRNPNFRNSYSDDIIKAMNIGDKRNLNGAVCSTSPTYTKTCFIEKTSTGYQVQFNGYGYDKDGDRSTGFGRFVITRKFTDSKYASSSSSASTSGNTLKTTKVSIGGSGGTYSGTTAGSGPLTGTYTGADETAPKHTIVRYFIKAL